MLVDPSEPLAITGMACRLPGANGLEEFWQLLVSGQSGIVDVPDELLDRRLYSSTEKSVRSKTYSTISGLIKRTTADPPVDLRSADVDNLKSDPCHEILFQVVIAALSHANWPRDQVEGSRTGTYVGHSSGTSLGGEQVLATLIPQVAAIIDDLPQLKELAETDRQRVLQDFVATIQCGRPTRNDDGPWFDAHFASRLIAQRLKLRGPEMVIDAACASSLVALALAAAALRQGEIDQAIVAGASCYKTDSLILFSQAQSCSASGSKPFDADADGLVNAEGYAVVLLKTLRSALESGDTIHGIIRGIGLSSDGRGRSLWAPRKEGQIEAMRRAYSEKVGPQSVQYVEAHATSTQVGDATELEGLGGFFPHRRDGKKIPVGSVKSNIGHCLETAGLASLIKCLLCMREGRIVPTINLTKLNPSIDWDSHPFVPVTQTASWPDMAAVPRRSAVNGFGIGGLNVHVVVDGPCAVIPKHPDQANGSVGKLHAGKDFATPKRDRLAIIGRGVIVPGANSFKKFCQIVASGASQLVPPPADRWRRTVYDQTRPGITNAYRQARGGYVLNYQYDWRKHRIPPKQVDQGNPLQFMLLDAAQEALEESGYSTKPFDRTRAAVIVGTLFGGEFSHHLQIGLRLPEILDTLSRTLASQGWTSSRIQDFCRDVEATIVEHYPAICDQSGSFTSSTQASRIAKTLDIMGGAMAIDCGDSSSLAALQSAQHLISTGTVDMVFCAAAQRGLDAVEFEAWDARQSTLSGGEHEASFPGEGVVVLLLRRLSDAVRDGDPIFGVIDQVTNQKKARRNQSFPQIDHQPTSNSWIAQNSAGASKLSKSLDRQFGHLQSAKGLLEVVTVTVDAPASTVRRSIFNMPDPCLYEAIVESAPFANVSMTNSPTSVNGLGQDRYLSLQGARGKINGIGDQPVNGKENIESPQDGSTNMTTVIRKATSDDVWIHRVWGANIAEVENGVQRLLGTTADVEKAFPDRAPYRLAIVASPATLQARVEIALKRIHGLASPVRCQNEGVFYSGPSDVSKPAAAGMFPGQGSQYPGMTHLLESSSTAGSVFERLVKTHRQMGLKFSRELIESQSSNDQSDLRNIQLLMLAANVSAFEVARQFGFQPDFLIGHSFGEYAALVAANAISFESAIAISHGRADAIARCEHGQGAMLSISAPYDVVSDMVENCSDVFVSHVNSPRQTVAAGTCQAVNALAAALKLKGIPAVSVAVGSPFHTPLLSSATPVLKSILQQHRWRPPQIPLLSSVTGQFVADREVIIDNLAKQLSQPVDWTTMVERLIDEDVRVFVELGPGRVLTKLTQQSIAERNIFAVSFDEPKLSLQERLHRIRAALEVAGVAVNQETAMRFPNAPSLNSNLVGSVASTNRVRQVTQEKPNLAEPIPNVTASVTPKHETTASNEGALSDFIINIIVEQTGYPRDVIELDWDLEADLGIDSIRKAQILGELGEYFDLSVLRDTVNLQELRTIRNIVQTLVKAPGKSDWLSNKGRQTQEESIENTITQDNECKNEPTVAGQKALAGSFDPIPARDLQLDQLLIDFVVERTGYPREIIELDADLEADLGFDSIMKAQLLGELRDRFELPQDELVRTISLSELTTLRQIRDTVNLVSTRQSASVVRVASTAKSNGHTPTFVERSRRPKKFVTNSKVLTLPSPGLAFPGNSEFVSAFHRGVPWGERHRNQLQQDLFDLADRFDFSNFETSRNQRDTNWDRLTLDQDGELRGIADGAQLHPQSLLNLRGRLLVGGRTVASRVDSTYSSVCNSIVDHTARPTTPRAIETGRTLTSRYCLRMSPGTLDVSNVRRLNLTGGAIVLGNSEDATQLVRRLKSSQVPVEWIHDLSDREEAIRHLDKIWESCQSPNLFILTARDSQSATQSSPSARLNETGSRIRNLYWFCQRWFNLVDRDNLFDDACLVGAVSMGGDFGVSHQISSPESGAVAGLLKAIIIETWVSGHRSFPIKIVDFSAMTSPEQVAHAICVELDRPSYDVEIGWDENRRCTLQTALDPLTAHPARPLVPIGDWVVTGGARGITAYLVRTLGRQFPGVRFHLIGTSLWRAFSAEERRQAALDPQKFRDQFLRESKRKSPSPLRDWQELEKQIEIDRTLEELRSEGLSVTYHSCDVSNRDRLEKVLAQIRSEHGPIRGIIHGAGISKDASFPRKDAAMVEKCIAAKIDGAINLMRLTANDPLQAFLSFGSISGRFGANGHSDYSMSNEMLAKLMVWNRQMRPAVPSTVFHWHAWDDIGMAIKPETRLALEMIGMKLMPANEGANHLIWELEAGLPKVEVVITDDRYYRLFYPADRVRNSNEALNSRSTHTYPLVRQMKSDGNHGFGSEAILNPKRDPFLIEHRLKDKPLLPMVIMIELMAEGASLSREGKRPVCVSDLEISSGVKFLTDAEAKLQVIAQSNDDEGSLVELRSEVRSSNGRLLDPGRLCAKALIAFEPAKEVAAKRELDWTRLATLDWQPVIYPNEKSDFYSGMPLRCLRKVAIETGTNCLWGRIAVPLLSELAGTDRDISNWLTPSAVLDAALFASGILAWDRIRPGVALPSKLKQFWMFHQPRPAETCILRTEVVGSDDRSVTFEFTMWGADGQPVFWVKNYVATWVMN